MNTDIEFERSTVRVCQLNLTPLVDVVFLLLIFFMLTSSFDYTESLELSFPSGAIQVAPGESPLIIVVADRDRLFLQNKAVQSAALAPGLKELLKDNPDQRIIIMSTNNVSVQRVVSVMDEVYKAGGQNLSLSNWRY